MTPTHRHARTIALPTVAATLLCGLTPLAAADWTVVNLHPLPLPGVTGSYSHTYGAGGNVQVGDFAPFFQSGERPCMWVGSASTWVDLTPPGGTGGFAWGAGGGQQVGRVPNPAGGGNVASLWRGSGESWVNLNPAGSTDSWARATDGIQQVGEAFASGGFVASLWSGTAASWIALAASPSIAYGIAGGQQVGGVGGHAALWRGTPESFVDMHPPGADTSVIFNTDGHQQVGATTINGVRRAALWNGTANSWIDLHPPGATDSVALGTYQGMHVGYARINDTDKAILWEDATGGIVDLNTFVPPGLVAFAALGISGDGVNTYIAAQGGNQIIGRPAALIWVRPVCSYLSLTSQTGDLRPCPGAAVSFSVAATGGGARTYQWRRNTAPINTATNLSAATDTLLLNSVQPLDAGLYDCVITNGCGSLTSNPARLTVGLIADINHDNAVDTIDLAIFLGAFGHPAKPGSPAAPADLNGDNLVNTADLVAFLGQFGRSCP